MRQALDIFRKDVRHAWPQIAIAIALTAVSAWRLATRPFFVPRNLAPSDLFLFVLLGWWYLISTVVHQEAAVGDRQFWLTRPYSWKSILLAKALLILVFINLPVLLADIAILTAQGLSPASAISNLFWRQIALTGVLLLPAAALSAVTRDLSQFALVGIPIVLVPLIFRSLLLLVASDWGPMDWMVASLQAAVVLLGALIVFVWQYARRRTAVSYAILAGAVLLWSGTLFAENPWTAAIALQSHFPSLPDSVAGMHLALMPDGRPVVWRRMLPEIHFPACIRGLPSGMQAQLDQVELRIETRHGELGRAVIRGYLPPWNDNAEQPIDVPMDSAVLDAAMSQPVTLRLSAALTVFEAEPVVRQEIPRAGQFHAAGLGGCAIEPGYLFQPHLACRMASRPDSQIGTGSGAILADASYSPYGAVFDMSPVFYTASIALGPVEAANSVVTVTRRRPIAHIRRDLEIHEVRLASTRPEKP